MNSVPSTGKLKNPRPAEPERRFAAIQRFCRPRIMTVVLNLTLSASFQKWENGATELAGIEPVD
jgi:hypothetical protein